MSRNNPKQEVMVEISQWLHAHGIFFIRADKCNDLSGGPTFLIPRQAPGDARIRGVSIFVMHERNRPTPAQDAWIANLEACSYYTCIAFDPDDVTLTLKMLGLIPKTANETRVDEKRQSVLT